MTDLDKVQSIRNIAYGGPVQQGQGIVFKIVFEDGTQTNCYCRHDQLAMVVANLTAFGHLAEQLRAGAPKEAVRVSTPYKVTGVFDSGHTYDGIAVAIAVNTAQGFPLELVMTPDLARKAIEFLQRELTNTSQTPPQDRRN